MRAGLGQEHMTIIIRAYIRILTKNFPRVAQGGKLPKKVKKVAKKPERWEAGKIGSIFQQVGSYLVRGNPERW